MSRLELAPCSWADAKAFTDAQHRHLGAPVGHLWSTAAVVAGEVVGVIVIGRPVARALDDKWTVEVIRCTTTGHANACSSLYSAAWRAAKARGFRSATTMTMESEDGASLRASGWTPDGQVRRGHGGWGRRSRSRQNAPNPPRVRWWAPGSDRGPHVQLRWPEEAEAAS